MQNIEFTRFKNTPNALVSVKAFYLNQVNDVFRAVEAQCSQCSYEAACQPKTNKIDQNILLYPENTLQVMVVGKTAGDAEKCLLIKSPVVTRGAIDLS